MSSIDAKGFSIPLAGLGTCSTSRAQSRPRKAQVPNPASGMEKPFASMLDIGYSRSRLFRRHIVQERQQEQSAAARFTGKARRHHRVRHGALQNVVDERATLVARGDPGALHLAQLDL